METRKIILYYAEWMIPLSTGPYILLTEWYQWDWFTAYITASLFAGTLFYPINRWIFKR